MPEGTGKKQRNQIERHSGLDLDPRIHPPKARDPKPVPKHRTPVPLLHLVRESDSLPTRNTGRVLGPVRTDILAPFPQESSR